MKLPVAPGRAEVHQHPPNIAGAAARISLETLKSQALFSKLPDTILAKLQLHVREVRFEAGAVILRAGVYNTEAHYLTDGVVEVRFPEIRSTAAIKPSPERAADQRWLSRVSGMLGMPRRKRHEPSQPLSPDQTVILSDMPVDLDSDGRAVLQKGDIFGEMSAISRFPVSADVVAVTDVTCLLISSYALTKLLFNQAALADFKKEVQSRYRSRTLSTHLRRISLFASFDDEVLSRIIQNAQLVEFEPEDMLRVKGEQREEVKKKVMSGVQIVEQNTPGDALYVVIGGHVKVAVQAGASDLAVTYLRKGDFAGELCLLMDEPWPFSLYALEHVEMAKILRADVDAIMASSPEAQRLMWRSAVKRLKERGFALRNPQASRQVQMAMDTGLIHGESVLLIDLSTCTRCDDCVRACADTHGGTPRFIREGLRYERWSVVTACYQCTDPVCMVNCPTGAITRGLGTLEVTIDEDICVGCEACAKSCPWDNITMVPNRQPTDFIRNYPANKNRTVLERLESSVDQWAAAPAKFINLATKCDLCVGRSAGPACVQMCPHGSAVRISFKDLETVARTLG